MLEMGGFGFTKTVVLAVSLQKNAFVTTNQYMPPVFTFMEEVVRLFDH